MNLAFFRILRGDVEPDVREGEACGRGGDGGFEVFGESLAWAEPGEGALDDLSLGRGLEAFDAFGALDDLDAPWFAIGESIQSVWN